MHWNACAFYSVALKHVIGFHVIISWNAIFIIAFGGAGCESEDEFFHGALGDRWFDASLM
jgi:hypothetical protein